MKTFVRIRYGGGRYEVRFNIDGQPWLVSTEYERMSGGRLIETSREIWRLSNKKPQSDLVAAVIAQATRERNAS